MMPLTDSQAEAGKALAETTGKALDLTKGIGSYLAETICTITQDLLGLAGGDWLHEKRQRNLAQMQAKTARILEGVERERISEPSPSVIVPLLEAAKNEGRGELQELWAALLARALVDGGKTARKSFYELLATLDLPDVITLRIVSGAIPITIEEKRDSVQFNKKFDSYGLFFNSYGASKMVLIEQDCLVEDGNRLTPWGWAFLEAVEPPEKLTPAPGSN